MAFFVYVLLSKADNSFYIGYTKNLEKRISKHNTAKSGYTARKQPWILFYYEVYSIKSDAIRREQFLKSQKNRDFYKKLVQDQI